MSSGVQPQQLAIRFPNPEQASFGNFYTGANRELVSRLQGLAAAPVTPGFWLWGASGVGCSHLLHATCQLLSANGGSRQGGCRTVYLPLALIGRDPEILDGVEADLLAIDDLDCWIGEAQLEARLMGAYQNVTGIGGTVLIGATGAAARLNFALADFASRMRGLASFEVRPPDDEGLKQLLREAANRRGLSLDAAVLEFWLNRSARRYPALLEQLERIDRRALSEQRRVTIPLVKEVLQI